MIGDVKRKAILEFEADLSSLDDAYLAAESHAEGLKRQNEQLAKSIDAVSLKAPKIGVLGKAFNNFKGDLGSVGGFIEGVSKKLAPMNQAVELAGKVIRVADAGLDSYAKTSKQAAAEVAALRDEFNGYKEAVLAGVGAATVALGGHLATAEELKKKYIEIENTKFFRAFGLRADGKRIGDFLLGDDEANNSTFDPAKFDAFRDNIEINYISKLEEAKKKWDELQAAAKRAREEDEKFIQAFHDMQLAELRVRNRITPHSDKPGFSAVDFTDLSNNGAAGILGAGASLDSRQSADERYNARRKSRLLDSLGIDDSTTAKLQVVTSALSAFRDGFGQTVQAIATGSLSAGEAFKQLAGTVLNSVGAKLAGLAAEQFIEAGVNAILLNPVASAQHLAAGALYTAGAAAAYAAGGRLGGGGSSSTPSAGVGGVGASAAPSIGSRSSGPSERIIVFAGNSFSRRDSPRMRQLYARQAIDEAYGASGVSYR